jgi:uroporphyrinogen decarboxylase
MSQAEMTMHERMTRMYEHREADRCPIVDGPWPSTIERWQREGMPADADWIDYLGVDRIVSIGVDNSPRFPVEVLEETDEHIVHTNEWGLTKKDFRDRHSTPQRLEYRVKDPDAWAEAKERMQPDPSRVDWDRLRRNYRSWREQGAWISAAFWYGFEVTYSHMVGPDLFLAMVEQPEWVLDMVNTYLDLCITMFEMVWDAGYHFDQVNTWNDMGFKGKQFMSVQMYRDLFKPADRRLAEWAHQRGLKMHYHSCGNINPLVPELIDAGIDLLNPMEVKAGMDPLQLKSDYGDKLAFHGGLNALLYREPEKMWAEMERVIPVMKTNGGYIIATDHSIPDNASLDTYRHFVVLAKKLGSYD